MSDLFTSKSLAFEYSLCADSYERKGRLNKKGLNTDSFKERTFVLTQEHLFYFKSDKSSKPIFKRKPDAGKNNFNLIILTEATIKLFDYDTLMKRRPLPVLPPWLSKSRPHVLEIENPTRKYILSAKSLFDLQEWYKAIYGHIETLSENQNIA